MKIDHIGYAVKDIEKSKPMFERPGYIFGDTILDESRNIVVAFGLKMDIE